VEWEAVAREPVSVSHATHACMAPSLQRVDRLPKRGKTVRPPTKTEGWEQHTTQQQQRAVFGREHAQRVLALILKDCQLCAVTQGPLWAATAGQRRRVLPHPQLPPSWQFQREQCAHT
jgi:hypothetical protein